MNERPDWFLIWMVGFVLLIPLWLTIIVVWAILSGEKKLSHRLLGWMLLAIFAAALSLPGFMPETGPLFSKKAWMKSSPPPR